MDPMARHVAERDCASICTQFFHFLDRRDYSAVASLIAEDGVWIRQGLALTGGAEVRSALEARPSDFETRHLLNNVVVEILDASSARVAYDLSVYTRNGISPAIHAAIMSGTDLLGHDGAAWRIRLKQAEKIFGFTG